MNEKNVTINSISRKTLLYRSQVEYGDWCINHIEGCSHGCRYPCYAMMMAKRFGKVKSYDEWINPKLVSNSLELLDKEIPKYKSKIKFVHLSFTTDPFMYNHPEIEMMTLKIIKKLNENNIRVTVLTKGSLPEELSDFSKYSIRNEYGITLVSTNEDFRKEYEPNTIDFFKRIASLKALSNKGLTTWVSIEPYPTASIDKMQNLDFLLKQIKFANKIIFGKMNYNSSANKSNGFYDKVAKQVQTFCKENNIDCHIKFGTQEIDNIGSCEMFKVLSKY